MVKYSNYRRRPDAYTIDFVASLLTMSNFSVSCVMTAQMMAKLALIWNAYVQKAHKHTHLYFLTPTHMEKPQHINIGRYSIQMTSVKYRRNTIVSIVQSNRFL